MIAIRVENLSKLYHIGARQERYKALRDTFTDALYALFRRLYSTFKRSNVIGMRKAEIDRKFDEIVAFAGVEMFIDTPVKRCSR